MIIGHLFFRDPTWLLSAHALIFATSHSSSLTIFSPRSCTATHRVSSHELVMMPTSTKKVGCRALYIESARSRCDILHYLFVSSGQSKRHDNLFTRRAGLSFSVSQCLITVKRASGVGMVTTSLWNGSNRPQPRGSHFGIRVVTQ